MTQRSNEKWFKIDAGGVCGVVLKEGAAKRLMKILYRQSEEIKDFLMQNKEDLEVYNWTLAYPNGKQEVVYYSYRSEWDSLEERIKLFDKTAKLYHIKDFFISDDDYKTADEEVCKLYMEMYNDEVEE